MAEETKNQQIQNDDSPVQQAEPKAEPKPEKKEEISPVSDEEKAELEEFRKWKESQKSEIEKQTAAYQKSEKARIEAETRISDYEAKFAALENGVSADSVDDVVALARLKTDKNTSLEQAIESVLEKYPQFRGKGITTGTHTNNNSKMSGVEAAFYAKNPDLKA